MLTQATQQRSLFDLPPHRPLARDADPITSHRAADKIKKKTKSQSNQILASIKKYADRKTGVTAKELAKLIFVETDYNYALGDTIEKIYYTIQRRLIDLQGRIEFLTTDNQWFFSLQDKQAATREECRIIRDYVANK